MRYWWVNQNQTYRHEVSGGYLWSPKRNAKGARNPFYESMREVAPGDLVFSFVNTRIPAVPPENSIPGDVRVVLTQNSNSDVVMMKTSDRPATRALYGSRLLRSSRRRSPPGSLAAATSIDQ